MDHVTRRAFSTLAIRRSCAACIWMSGRIGALARAVQACGAVTSLDMAQPDPDAEAGRVDWLRLLQVYAARRHLHPKPGRDALHDRPPTLRGASRPARHAESTVNSCTPSPTGCWRWVRLSSRSNWAARVFTYARPTTPTGWLRWAGWRSTHWCGTGANCWRLFRATVVGTTGSGDCTITRACWPHCCTTRTRWVCSSWRWASQACSVGKAPTPPAACRRRTLCGARIAGGWTHHPLTVSLAGWHNDGGPVWFGPG